MKQKNLLLIALVLLAVQVSASSVDALVNTLENNELWNKCGNHNSDGIGIDEELNGFETTGYMGSQSLSNYLGATSSLSFPNQPVGEAVKKTVSIDKYTYSANGVLVSSINDISLELNDQSGMFAVAEVEVSNSSFKITVTYNPKSVGSHTASLKVKMSVTQYSQFGVAVATVNTTETISLTGNAVPFITVSKTSLDFGTVIKGKSQTRTFTVKGTGLTGNLNLSVSSYYKVSPSSITASEAAAGKTVTVTYAPTVVGTHNVNLTISGGGASNKTVTLKGKCIVPTITTSATSLSFGTIAKGKSSTKSFTVKGTNLTGPLTLTPSGATGMYTITPRTITAAQAASGVTVKVTYKPTATGTHKANIAISGGDAPAGKTVSLTGTCGTPVIKTSKSSISFCQTGSNSFVVTGTYLTGNLTLTLSGSSIFTISRTYITAAQAANGVTVSVSCIPKNVQRATAKITISGGGASSRTVSLSYAQNQPLAINSVQPEAGSEDGKEGFTNGGLLNLLENSTTDVKEFALDTKIYAEGQNIIVESPIEQNAMISDVAGHSMTVGLQVGRNKIPVDASGVFIVRIREKTAKLILK